MTPCHKGTIPISRPRGREGDSDLMTSFFEWILNGIYSVVNNYGVAVILFTLLVRLIILPLDIKSRKSMRAMTKVQPKMHELQKKYANDKDKLNQKMSELYKKEHVNPLMGCLPMLIQLPVLFIMFAAMRNIASVETGKMLLSLLTDLADKGAEVVGPIATQGFGWIKNVFQPDSFGSMILPNYSTAISAIHSAGLEFTAPEGMEAIYNTYLNLHYGASEFMTLKIVFFNISVPTTLTALWQYANGLFILPLFAGVSQLLMTKITSAQQAPSVANDPNQPANMMNSGLMKWFFPLFSLYICSTYNSAFALYWAAANIIAIVQQIVLNKYFDHKDKLAAAAAAQEENN